MCHEWFPYNPTALIAAVASFECIFVYRSKVPALTARSPAVAEEPIGFLLVCVLAVPYLPMSEIWRQICINGPIHLVTEIVRFR